MSEVELFGEIRDRASAEVPHYQSKAWSHYSSAVERANKTIEVGKLSFMRIQDVHGRVEELSKKQQELVNLVKQGEDREKLRKY